MGLPTKTVEIGFDLPIDLRPRAMLVVLKEANV
jgi:hypothetical protein